MLNQSGTGFALKAFWEALSALCSSKVLAGFLFCEENHRAAESPEGRRTLSAQHSDANGPRPAFVSCTVLPAGNRWRGAACRVVQPGAPAITLLLGAFVDALS